MFVSTQFTVSRYPLSVTASVVVLFSMLMLSACGGGGSSAADSAAMSTDGNTEISSGSSGGGTATDPNEQKDPEVSGNDNSGSETAGGEDTQSGSSEGATGGSGNSGSSSVSDDNTGSSSSSEEGQETGTSQNDQGDTSATGRLGRLVISEPVSGADVADDDIYQMNMSSVRVSPAGNIAILGRGPAYKSNTRLYTGSVFGSVNTAVKPGDAVGRSCRIRASGQCQRGLYGPRRTDAGNG